MELERTFFEGMKRLLQDDLGVKAPLVGTADHADSYCAYTHIQSNMVFDFLDGHGYWHSHRYNYGVGHSYLECDCNFECHRYRYRDSNRLPNGHGNWHCDGNGYPYSFGYSD